MICYYCAVDAENPVNRPRISNFFPQMEVNTAVVIGRIHYTYNGGGIDILNGATGVYDTMEKFGLSAMLTDAIGVPWDPRAITTVNGTAVCARHLPGTRMGHI